MAILESKTDADDSFKSYKEFLDSLAQCNPYYTWLAKYFAFDPFNEEEENDLRIWDSRGDGLREVKVPIPQLLEGDDTLRTRVVIFRHGESFNVSRKILGELAFALDLTPLFLWGHLYEPIEQHAWKNISSPEDRLSAEEDVVELKGAFPYGTDGFHQFSRTNQDGDELHLSWGRTERWRTKLIPFGPDMKSTLVFVLVRDPFNDKGKFIYTDFWKQPRPRGSRKQLKDAAASPKKDLSEHYVTLLSDMSKEECAKADPQPINYIIPLLKLVLFRTRLETERTLAILFDLNFNAASDPELENNEAEEEQIQQLLGTALTFQGAIDALESVMGDSPPGNQFHNETLQANTHRNRITKKDISHDDTPQNDIAYNEVSNKETPQNQNKDLRAILTEYKIFVQTLKSETDDLRDETQRRVSLVSLKAAQKSIQEAESAKRISQLAYIYLPLSFSSALYGMNISQFEGASLNAFVITSIVLLCISLMLWWTFNPLLQWTRRALGFLIDAMPARGFVRILKSTVNFVRGPLKRRAKPKSKSRLDGSAA